MYDKIDKKSTKFHLVQNSNLDLNSSLRYLSTKFEELNKKSIKLYQVKNFRNK